MNVRQLSTPRWDYNRVLFEIDDGEHRISCAISQGALQELSGRRQFRPLELLACFNRDRSRIERIALDKTRARHGSMSGLVTIWLDDLDDQADNPEDAPSSSSI